MSSEEPSTSCRALAAMGLDLSTLPIYQRGVDAEQDCEKALKDPKGYLDGKPGLEAAFIADIRRQRALGVSVGAAWIT